VIDRGRVIANDTPAALKAHLGSTVIELGMGEEARAARALELLAASLPARPERQAATIRLASQDGARVLIEVLRRLDDQRLTPATLAVREPSLDDVFLSLTGRRADDEVAGDGHGSRGGAA
jgi:ABC-2 type transport system ATP-binding protein